MITATYIFLTATGTLLLLKLAPMAMAVVLLAKTQFSDRKAVAAITWPVTQHNLKRGLKA